IHLFSARRKPEMPYSRLQASNNFVTFVRYTVLTFQEFFQSMVLKDKTIMKKILLLAALLIGSISAASAADHRVRVTDFRFGPKTVNAVVGDTISWVWQNGMHTTTSVSVPAGAMPWNAPMDISHT